MPEEILKRIEGEGEDAYRSEIQDIENLISAGIDRHLEERKKFLEARAGELQSRISAESDKALAELREFEAGTLQLLGAEAERRRTERLAAQETQQAERVRNEEEEAKRSAAEEEEKRKKAAAAAADPALQVRTLLKQIHGHMDRGDMELAAGAVAKALELDAFNAELIDLDAKIREAREADTFGTSAAPPPTEKKAEKKARKKEKEGTPEGATTEAVAEPGTAPAAASPQPRKKFPSWILSAVAALLIAAAAVIVYVQYVPKHSTDSMTVAVLPWTDSGNQPATKIFATALPEMVLRLLSREPSPINLLGFSTTMNLSRLSTDPVSSLRTLGYSHFLRGRIGGTDSTYSLSVELTDSAGNTLWSAEYNRDAASIVLVPSEIAHDLNRYFATDVSKNPSALQVKNPEAYFLYLRGLADQSLPNGSGIDDAVSAFSRSVVLDSTLAESQAGLASVLMDKYAGDSRGDTALLNVADASAANAIRLRPTLSDGYMAMARVLIEERRYEDALALLDSCSRFAPRDSRVPFLRGVAFFRSGRIEQSLDLLRKAYRLDPRNTGILSQLATVHQVEKSFDRALWFRETAMFFSPDSSADLIGPLSDVITLDPALRLKQADRVTSACLRALKRNPDDYTALYSLARMLQVNGDIQESITYFNRLEGVLRGMVRSNTADTRARMYLGLTLTRIGKYAEGLAIAQAAAAANPNSIDAKYYLARIYALQMNAPGNEPVDETGKTRAIDMLREALGLRFDNAQLVSADFYNVYSKADIRDALRGGER